MKKGAEDASTLYFGNQLVQNSPLSRRQGQLQLITAIYAGTLLLPSGCDARRCHVSSDKKSHRHSVFFGTRQGAKLERASCALRVQAKR